MSENFGLSTKKIFHCSLTAFKIFKGTFEVKNFDWDPYFQRFLSRLWVVCSNFCRNVFRTVVKTAFCVSRGKFWIKFLQNLRLFLQVWALSKHLLMFWPWSFTTVLKTKFNMFRGTIGEKSFLYSSKFFFILSEFFLQFWQKYFRRVAKTELNVSGRNI